MSDSRIMNAINWTMIEMRIIIRIEIRSSYWRGSSMKCLQWNDLDEVVWSAWLCEDANGILSLAFWTPAFMVARLSVMPDTRAHAAREVQLKLRVIILLLCLLFGCCCNLIGPFSLKKQRLLLAYLLLIMILLLSEIDFQCSSSLCLVGSSGLPCQGASLQGLKPLCASTQY